MSQTKVTDAVRDTTAVDATKLTGTVDNARITLDAAEIPSLDADKITTGSIDAARIPEAAVTQHVQATDLSSVKHDIAMLALYNAVSDNRAAYNLPNSFIDQFEDETGTTTRTDVARDTDEFFSSVYVSLTGGNWNTGDRRIGSELMATQSGWSPSAGNVDYLTAGNIGETASNAMLGTALGFDNTGDYFQFSYASGGEKCNTSARWYRNATTTIGNWQWSASNTSGSGYVDIGSPFLLGGIASGAHPGIPNILTELSENTVAYRYYRLTGTGGQSTGNNWDSEIEFYENDASTAANPTGTLISDQQTAPALTKMSGVVLVKDGGSSTTVMGTHLKIYFCATGTAASFPSAWVEADSYTAVTAPFSTGVTMYKLGETTVPSGTNPTIRAVWASQTSGGYESQLHGWAMNY